MFCVCFSHWLVLCHSQSYNAKISDFGLARVGPEADATHVSTQVMGTHGYAAPEYIATGKHGYAISLYIGF